MATKQGQQTTPINVQNHLKGMDYPAEKADLIEHAENQNAPQDVIDALESIPDREYENAADVSSELGGSSRT